MGAGARPQCCRGFWRAPSLHQFDLASDGVAPPGVAGSGNEPKPTEADGVRLDYHSKLPQ